MGTQFRYDLLVFGSDSNVSFSFCAWLGQLECGALMEALQQCSFLPRIVTMLAKSLHRVLQLAPEPTIKSLRTLEATSIITHVMEQQKKVHFQFKAQKSTSNLSFYSSFTFP